jgi:hypothetical protein
MFLCLCLCLWVCLCLCLCLCLYARDGWCWGWLVASRHVRVVGSYYKCCEQKSGQYYECCRDSTTIVVKGGKSGKSAPDVFGVRESDDSRAYAYSTT